jgi:5-keto-L-gluconate epimerase
MKLAVAFCPFTNLSEYAPYPFMGDIQNCIEKAKEYNFDGIEVSIRTPEDLDVEKCESLLSKHGLAISAIATGHNYGMDGLSFVSPERPLRNEILRRMKLNIDFASRHNASVIIGGVRGDTPAAKGAGRDEVLSRVRECTEQLLEYAVKRDVTLVFEAVNRYEIACGKSLDDTANIIRSYNHSNLKMLADTYHMNIEEVSFYNSICNNSDVLGYVHLCDNNRMAAGLGRLDFTPIFKALTDMKYDGYLCAEVLPLPNPETVLRTTRDTYLSYTNAIKKW